VLTTEQVRHTVRTLRYGLSFNATHLLGAPIADSETIISGPAFQPEIRHAEKQTEDLLKTYRLLRRFEREARRRGIHLARWQGRDYVETTLRRWTEKQKDAILKP
jgi:hypothetical protein